MKKRNWLSKQKLQIVLEGLSGQIEIVKLCAKYQIAQTQYYLWRDQLLKFGYQAFETKNAVPGAVPGTAHLIALFGPGFFFRSNFPAKLSISLRKLSSPNGLPISVCFIRLFECSSSLSDDR